jgi:hypothetical protein
MMGRQLWIIWLLAVAYDLGDSWSSCRRRCLGVGGIQADTAPTSATSSIWRLPTLLAIFAGSESQPVPRPSHKPLSPVPS